MDPEELTGSITLENLGVECMGRPDRNNPQGRIKTAGGFSIIMAILISVMILSFIPKATGENTASSAAVEKGQNNTWLGTAGLSNPDIPVDKDTPWSGSYVYFGTYNGNPIKFRVLAKDSTAYTSEKALFLDSDVSLFDSDFDHTKPYFNSWNDSSIQGILNGSFLDGFSASEQAAIAASTGNDGCVYAPGTVEAGACGAPIRINDKVFLLDPTEIQNESYGYYPSDGTMEVNGRLRSVTVYNHKKSALSVPDAG